MKPLIFEKDETVFETLSQLLQFPGVFTGADAALGHPYGKANTHALDYFLKIARADGFKTQNHDNQVGYIQFGDQEEYIGVLCHLDVVPAGNYWTEEPFGGRVAEDRIYGRGALDDKGPAVASYYALKALKESGAVLDKSIRLILGLNEETGSACVKHYRTIEKPPVAGFTPDADFPVIYAEKGITTFSLEKQFTRNSGGGALELISVTGGTVVNMVPDYCEATLVMTDQVYADEALGLALLAFNERHDVALKVACEGHVVILKLRGVSAHASTPEVGRNAVSYMMTFLSELPLGKGDLVDAVHAYTELIGLEVHGGSIGMGLSDEASGKLTLNVGTLYLDQDGIRVHCNVRYPVSVDGVAVYNETFKRLVDQAGFEVEVSHDVAPIIHDRDGSLVQTLMAVYREHTGDLEAAPICIGGGTYARSIPNIVAFGPLFPHTHDTMHQADEYVTKADLLLMTRMFADAMYRLAK